MWNYFQEINAMYWIIFFSVLRSIGGFNIEPVAWRSFTNPALGFGHKVIQKQNGLLVSAPLQQDAQQRGQIYECSPTTTTCRKIQLELPDYAVNSSLGLAMAFNPRNEKSLVCGPTIPKDCRSITMYNGLCLEIDQNNGLRRTTPRSTADCPSQPADIAFLLDGSGSVDPADFSKMKQFVINVIKSFLGKDSRFAIIQFSRLVQISYYFNTFPISESWESNIESITQLKRTTYTATAIQRVVDEVFIPSNGNRPNANNVLIVITDGVSHDKNYLPGASEAANRKNIIRFAIGVGDSFNNADAKDELITIAASEDRVFQVQGFDALDKIRQTLQEKIFSIEGTQTGGETLKMEMSQLGFGAAFLSEGFQMTAVGANEWKGALLKYTNSGTMTSSYEPKDIDNDSYLGYSIAIANTVAGTFTAVGAPRYQHRGIVMYVYSIYSQQRIDPVDWQFQSGEYFGAEVCTMDVNGDSFTDLLLISAPMYIERDREGRVYVCDVTDWIVDCHFDSPLILRGASERGRFGSSLAVLPDLNADNLADLAVGAPLENDGQGTIYIYHGSGFRRITPTYSQRITASEVKSGLTFFGMSISPTSLDQSNDGLPDLMVGSKGTVVLLRSKPIVKVDATISFTPQLIPTQNNDCSKPLRATATVCFTMSKVTTLDQAQAKINYTFTLDATRIVPNNRAFINEKQPDTTGSLTITLNHEGCVPINFFIQSCPEDALNPLYNELRFTFESLTSPQSLKPSLSQQSPTTVSKDLGFEINCGLDDTCTDQLIVDFNFTRSSVVRVGIDDLLNITVSLENIEENSYNTRVILTYPSGFSYRKFTGLQGRIDCNSVDSENSLIRGRTECFIDKPIFKSKAKAFFVVSYGFNTNSQLDRRIFVTANATSGNVQSSPLSQRYKMREIDVKYSISVTIGSSHSYTNFTFGENDLQKPVNQSVKVTNEIRALNFSVVIRVPVKLGKKDIWVDSDSLQIADCQKDKDEEPTVTDFVPQIQESKFVNCTVAKCRVFRCTRVMSQTESKDYIISANLSSGWIEQIGLKSAKFHLISTAVLEYDTDRFIFYSAENNPVKIEAEVEVYTEVDFTKEIIGGSLGALALLLLLTAGLYKAGFFKSKYQQMITDEAQGQEEALDGAPEEPTA
ncbi:integrin alpha-D-like [Periophthalmus magnuspinnatus]|uniref:integrin alpha-D-like n=1 Tax=Periophthalmus magnuspinnatus TaxID=409849 RepID=UPI0024366930|nr:integrin alpha-D-like [Periophthalmus magnuspinnatus]